MGYFMFAQPSEEGRKSVTIPVFYRVSEDEGGVRVRIGVALRVGELITSRVLTVAPEDSIQKAAQLMHAHQFSGLPVVDGTGKLVGMVTEYDLISRDHAIHIPSYIKFLDKVSSRWAGELALHAHALRSMRVKDVMTREVVTVRPEDEVREVARLFTHQRLNPIPVVDEMGIVVGIVSRSDIIKLFV